jgi:ComF family protein
MRVVHQFKYAGKIQLSKPLGRVLFAAFLKYFHDVTIDLILPVPPHASKIRARGFNQVMLMLTEWPELADALSLNSPTIDFTGKIFDRKKKTESQTGLGKEKRQSNVKGAFMVLKPDIIQSKQILLVDDVYTTGATTVECAKTLIKKGSGGVYILTLARAG